ncbi:MAG: hypothetical protein LBL95_02800 [Deltaproteobacteria bacterium]|jgi:16S rRNA (cytosine967-C5)-methyltransferase|nr:hypothetical protein [Deltaproteobacteria bacterium]
MTHGSKTIACHGDPRRVALDVLLAVEGGLERPEAALEARGRLLGELDRRLAAALVYACLRHRLRLEAIASSRLAKGRAPRRLMGILKIGLAQLLFFRVPAFAAVNETVGLARRIQPALAPVANAVLLRLAREKEEAERDRGVPFPIETCRGGAPREERLSVLYSHPLWLVGEMEALLGFRGARALLVAGNLPPGPTLRANPLKTSREALAAILPWPVVPTRFSPYGLATAGPSGRPDAWPGFGDGLFAIQDEASQILPLLAGEPRRVLDGCAGQGGKGLALATVFPGASVVSLDVSSRRLSRIAAEARRLGLARPPEVLDGDLRTASIPGAGFDLVLVDPPCSSLGIARRHPDVKWNVAEADLARISALELELLSAAAGHVASGGRLVYSVCTFLPAECEEVVAAFLSSRPDFHPLGPEAFPPVLGGLFSAPGQLRLWPHRDGTDGFFYAILERRP